MWTLGRLKRSRKGAGSIIGIAFLVLILMSGFSFYMLNVNANNNYRKTLQEIDELDWKRGQEKITFESVSVTGSSKLNVTVKNDGSLQSHLIWLGVFNKTATPDTQEYHELDEYVNPAETLPNVGSNITVNKEDTYVIQLVTELGNTFSYSYPQSEEASGQAGVTITGVNCTAEYNPSQWNLLGSTTNVSGSASNLTSNDGNYAVFRSYLSGTNTDITDFVDETCDSYLPSSKGTHSDFSAQQAGPDSIYDTLTEENTGGGASNSTLLNDGFEAFVWDANWDNIFHNWRRDNFLAHNGSASAWASNGYEGTFTCDNLNASGASAIYVDFWFRKQRTEFTDFTLYYYDGSGYNLIDELDDNGADNTWLHYTQKVTDSRYFVSNFRIRFDATLSGGENVWVDDVRIIKEQSNDNYQLDLGVQWTNADYNEANEMLCIYGGTMGSENIRVDVWTGSAWQNLFTDLSSGWNNVSVSPYLTSSTFTIRFNGNDETGDTTQDSWNIDATLLHVWTTTDEYTAEVEFTGSGNTADWTRLVWQIDSCWDIGEVNTTIQFYNYTLGDYAPSGNGYVNYVSDATPNTDELKSQTITSNPDDFKNSTGHWAVKIKGVKTTSTQFLMKIDWIELNLTYSSSGNSVPYNSWQWYTITATTADGDPIPYAYASVYTNGTNITLRNASDQTSIPNPAWVRLNADGEYQLEMKSTNDASETFVLYAVVGSVVGQKTITQEAP